MPSLKLNCIQFISDGDNHVPTTEKTTGLDDDGDDMTLALIGGAGAGVFTVAVIAALVIKRYRGRSATQGPGTGGINMHVSPLSKLFYIMCHYKSFLISKFNFLIVSKHTPMELQEEPTKPKKIKDVLEGKDFILDKSKSKKEFKELGSVDQQRHVLRFRQEFAKKYGKSNRYDV